MVLHRLKSHLNLPIKDFIIIGDEDCNEGHFPKVDIHYSEKLYDLHNDLPFLPENSED